MPRLGWLLAPLLLCLLVLSACDRASPPSPPLLLRPGALTPGSSPFSEDVDAEGRRRVREVSSPCLLPFFPIEGKATGTALLIIPGGGYQLEYLEAEGTEVGRRFAELGIASFVLVYRLPQQGLFDPLEDAQRAMRLLRSRAQELNLRRDRIGVLGFSAGAHLAAMLGTGMAPQVSPSRDEIDALEARPDFMGLLYPVIALEGPFGHEICRLYLLGSQASDDEARKRNTHSLVTSTTPPTFLFHSRDDDQVPILHSEAFAQALSKAKVPFEFAVVESGGHGFGLPPRGHPAADWPERFVKWLQAQNLIEGPNPTGPR